MTAKLYFVSDSMIVDAAIAVHRNGGMTDEQFEKCKEHWKKIGVSPGKEWRELWK